MRKGVLIGMVLLLVSCTHQEDPFFGHWTVDKVNVEFDADGTTPEMVRQIGAMEKNSEVIITADSMLMQVVEGDTMRGVCSLRGNQILCDGEPWGVFEEDVIKTETFTPLGVVKASYHKSNQ